MKKAKMRTGMPEKEGVFRSQKKKTREEREEKKRDRPAPLN